MTAYVFAAKKRTMWVTSLVVAVAIVAMNDLAFAQSLEYYEAAPVYTPHGMPLPANIAIPHSTDWDEHYKRVFKAAAKNPVVQASYNAHGLPISANDQQLANQWVNASQAPLQIDEIEPSHSPGPVFTPHGMPFGGSSETLYSMAGSPEMNRWVTAQRYDDHFISFRAEAVMLDREDHAGGGTVITTDGLAGLPVLSTDVGIGSEAGGMRLVAATEFFSSFDLEFAYLGGFEWNASDRAFSPFNSLFSVFSNFGTDVTLFAEETDQATEQTFQTQSVFDSLELNARFRWVAVTRPVGGSWIFGLRYIRLDEASTFTSFAEQHTDFLVDPPIVRGPGSLLYNYEVTNDLLGFQIGAEGFVAPLPSLMLGGDVKAGIYGNQVSNTARTFATTLPPEGLFEEGSETVAAFAAELNLYLTYRIVHEIYLRAGVNALYVSNVGLGSANFNTNSPFVPNRQTFVDTGGAVLLPGGHFGLEAQF